MKKIIVVIVVFVFFSQSGLPVLHAQRRDYSASLASHYGAYEYEESSYTPKRISKVKIISFPFMILATPLAFPAFYANTKEPDLKQSFYDYWRWIHYEVPYDLSEGMNKAIVKPDYYARIIAQQEEAETIDTVSYGDEFEERYKRLHDSQTSKSSAVDQNFEQTEIEEVKTGPSRRDKKIGRYMQRAENSYAAGDLDKARKYTKKVLKIEPTHARALSMHDQIMAHLDQEKTDHQLEVSDANVDDAQMVDDIGSISQDVTSTTSDMESESTENKKKISFFTRFFSLFKKDNKEKLSDQKQEDEDDMAASKELDLSGLAETIVHKKDLESEDALKSQSLERDRLGKAEKSVFTQTKLVPTKKRVVRVPPSINPQSNSVLNSPLDAKTKKRIKKLLKKGEKQYRRENFDKALKYYFQVLQLDIRNEQAQKMTRTITDIQRSHEIQKTLTSIQ